MSHWPSAFGVSLKCCPKVFAVRAEPQRRPQLLPSKQFSNSRATLRGSFSPVRWSSLHPSSLRQNEPKWRRCSDHNRSRCGYIVLFVFDHACIICDFYVSRYFSVPAQPWRDPVVCQLCRRCRPADNWTLANCVCVLPYVYPRSVVGWVWFSVWRR